MKIYHIDGSILFEDSADTIKETLENAVRNDTNLTGANLTGANLTGAFLMHSNLEGASLEGASLDGASLDGANLYRTNLMYSNLEGASLEGASLDGANLTGANLTGAFLMHSNLEGASLEGASLDGANLTGASLDGEIIHKTPIQINDLRWYVLITKGYMRIGCQRHSHQDWREFNDNQISKMAEGALGFWQQWGKTLLSICEENAK